MMTRCLAAFAATLLTGCAGVGPQTALAPAQISQGVSRSAAAKCPAAPGGSGLLADGDFSKATQPATYTLYAKGKKFAPSWHVASGSVKLISSTYWSVDGLCSVDLDGGTGGAIAHKRFATTSGAKYTVTFLLSGNGDGGPTVKSVKVAAAGDSMTFTWDTTGGNDPRHGKYAKKSWSFTAAASTTTLKIVNLDNPPTSYGPVVAGFSVQKK